MKSTGRTILIHEKCSLGNSLSLRAFSFRCSTKVITCQLCHQLQDVTVGFRYHNLSIERLMSSLYYLLKRPNPKDLHRSPYHRQLSKNGNKKIKKNKKKTQLCRDVDFYQSAATTVNCSPKQMNAGRNFFSISMSSTIVNPDDCKRLCQGSIPREPAHALLFTE